MMFIKRSNKQYWRETVDCWVSFPVSSASKHRIWWPESETQQLSVSHIESLTYLASRDASRERLWSWYPQWFPDFKQTKPKMVMSLVSESSSLYAHHLLRPGPGGSSAVQTSTPLNIIQAEIPFANTKRCINVFPGSQDSSLICPLQNRQGSHLQDAVHMILYCRINKLQN